MKKKLQNKMKSCKKLNKIAKTTKIYNEFIFLNDTIS